MRSVALVLAMAVTVAACGGGSTTGQEASATSGFLTVPLTDVRTGERFTLGSFTGKVTFFIAMAVW